MGILKVKMLGGFSMTYGTIPISLNRTGSAKSVRLLQMLLLSGENGIAKNELMDSLYGWSGENDSSDRNRNLNNLIYRLKKQLVAAGMPQDEYVVIRDGRCYWSSRLELELDAEQFCNRIRQAQRAEGEEQIRLYQQANECYFGELLPGNATDMWFHNRSVSYKELYLESIRVLEKEYRKKNDYKDRLALYQRAAALYPFENWQTEMIQCYLEMYRYEDALEVYNETMELYARELGSPPTDEMQRCFEQIELKDRNHNHSIRSAKEWRTVDKVFMGREVDIAKAIFGQDSRQGAYYCTYPGFIDYCRMIVRRTERYEFKAILMFLTLTQYEGKAAYGEHVLGQQMEILKRAIRSSLRSGDAFTRYGNRHYILMLTHIRKEDRSGVFSRIEAAFNRVPESRGELWYYVSMTQDLEQGIMD